MCFWDILAQLFLKHKGKTKGDRMLLQETQVGDRQQKETIDKIVTQVNSCRFVIHYWPGLMHKFAVFFGLSFSLWLSATNVECLACPHFALHMFSALRSRMEYDLSEVFSWKLYHPFHAMYVSDHWGCGRSRPMQRSGHKFRECWSI
jgi:hypothetical protein